SVKSCQFSTADSKFERIPAEVLRTSGFDDSSGAQLQPRSPIFGDWLRLYYVDHVLLEREGLLVVHTAPAAEFRVGSAFLMQKTVVDREPLLLYDRCRIKHILRRGARS